MTTFRNRTPWVVWDGLPAGYSSTWALRERAMRVDAGAFGGLDGDGDPWFVCRVTLAGGTRLDLPEGHDRPTIEREAARFNARRRY
jgi:hypothetical protein